MSSDDRFKLASFDPRFNIPSLKKNKVKVDERFSKAEIRKLKASESGGKAKVDRYGRKIEKNEDSGFDKYFEEEKAESTDSEDLDDKSDNEVDDECEDEDNIQGEDEEKETRKFFKAKSNKLARSQAFQVDADSKDDEDSDESESNENSNLEAQSSAFLDRSRGEGLNLGSSSEYSDSDSDSAIESEEMELEEERPEEGEPSSKLAVVNLDWENVRAVDLMSTFASFVPKGGNIKSVTIYPSEYGKEQMLKEDTEGPPKELFRSKKKNDVDLDSDHDIDLDFNNKEDLERAARMLYEEDNGEEDYNSKALRRYQLQRLRYYYAIVRCDLIATAKDIYDNCDGSEYESTANIFDLRYVPEGMEFDEDESKEVCTKIPSSYRPDSTFVTDALQHSKVKLTWDQTPKERLTLSTRLFSQKEVDDMDFKAYLASDSEESEAESSLMKDKYKNLLGDKIPFDKGKANDDEDDVDMEIIFNPALDENKVEKPEQKEETTIESYKRKAKERKEKRIEKYRAKNDDEQSAEREKPKKGKKGKNKNDRDPNSQAELELLLMDEAGAESQDHFNMRDVVKAEKKKGKKKGKKNYEGELIQNDFKPDVNDERFKEAFESHEFAIDPTSSEFKKTNVMKEILKERSKRQHRYDSASKQKKSRISRDLGAELKSLVKKLKQRK